MTSRKQEVPIDTVWEVPDIVEDFFTYWGITLYCVCVCVCEAETGSKRLRGPATAVFFVLCLFFTLLTRGLDEMAVRHAWGTRGQYSPMAWRDAPHAGNVLMVTIASDAMLLKWTQLLWGNKKCRYGGSPGHYCSVN